MKLIVLIPLFLCLVHTELIAEVSRNNSPNTTATPNPPTAVPHSQEFTDEKNLASNISTITSLLSQKYNNLLMRPTSLQSPPNDIKDALKSYHQQLVEFYRKNQPIPSSNSSSSENNIDNGLNNSIKGRQNMVKEGDFNNITGNTNIVNGSYNSIQGHHDVVEGSGNIVVSDPQAIAGLNKELEQLIFMNGPMPKQTTSQQHTQPKKIEPNNTATNATTSQPNQSSHETRGANSPTDLGPGTNTSQNGQTNNLSSTQQSLPLTKLSVQTTTATTNQSSTNTTAATTNAALNDTHVGTNGEHYLIPALLLLILGLLL